MRAPDRVPSRRRRAVAAVLVVAALLPAALRAVEVQPDPGPGGDAYKSALYRVAVSDGSRWVDSYTYATDNPSGSDCWSGGAVHFTSFGLSGPMEVAVTRLTGPISTVSLSPRSKRINPSVAGDTVRFPVKPYDKLWLTFDGEARSDTLLIFADPIRPTPPPGARVYRRGVQFVGDDNSLTYRPVNGQAVYFEAGAWVKGCLDLRGCRGARVMGPGILSGEAWDVREQGNPCMLTGARGAAVVQGGVELPAVNSFEGFTVVRAPGYHFKDVPADHVDNVKLISPWRHSTDGFQIIPHPDRPSVIEHCFAFVGDDVFFPRENFTGNLEIRDCFVSSTNNSIFQICYWGNPLDHPFAVHAHDIDVKNNLGRNSAVFRASLTAAKATGVKNMTFERIRLEGNLPEALFQIENRPYFWPAQTTRPETKLGNTYQMVFRDITLAGKQGKRSTLLGLDPENGHHDYVFDRVSIDGHVLNASNYADFIDINAFTSNVTFGGTLIHPPLGEPQVGAAVR